MFSDTYISSLVPPELHGLQAGIDSVKASWTPVSGALSYQVLAIQNSTLGTVERSVITPHLTASILWLLPNTATSISARSMSDNSAVSAWSMPLQIGTYGREYVPYGINAILYTNQELIYDIPLNKRPHVVLYINALNADGSAASDVGRVSCKVQLGTLELDADHVTFGKTQGPLSLACLRTLPSDWRKRDISFLGIAPTIFRIRLVISANTWISHVRIDTI